MDWGDGNPVLVFASELASRFREHGGCRENGVRVSQNCSQLKTISVSKIRKRPYHRKIHLDILYAGLIDIQRIPPRGDVKYVMNPHRIVWYISSVEMTMRILTI